LDDLNGTIEVVVVVVGKRFALNLALNLAKNGWLNGSAVVEILVVVVKGRRVVAVVVVEVKR